MTTVTTAQANKLYQVALFTAANRNRSMVNILTEQQDAPKAVSPDKKSTKQTSAGAPVVRITDLNKQAGDEVTFSIMHKLSKRPTMGDERVEGRGEDLSHADFSLKINQGRHLVDAGGRMSQQRTKFNLASSARTLLGTYFNDLQDQCAIVHLAGARGDFVADDTILPTADHPEFKKIMINDVLPPTHDRHFFGGDATSFEVLISLTCSLLRWSIISHCLLTRWLIRYNRYACPVMSCMAKIRITSSTSRRVSGMTGTPPRPARTGTR
ncbi:hypothetical protein AD23_5540 [Escherichia coli 2-005-03_S4_C3]|nr:hypothetical protein AD23_5565 [Escherichia coli 2-005-03_S4_C3]EZJ22798.1 hypothetical protein AD23_5540 [Escherichia coli 2-005-03_S4_C3]